MSESKKPRIFLSYSHLDRKVVDKIDNDFRRIGITLTRDVRDVKDFKGDFRSFMKQVKDADYVLCIVSDAFMKSRYCWQEMLEILEMEDFKERILPIVLPDAKIFDPVEKIRYYKYWEDRIEELDKEANTLKRRSKLKSVDEEINRYEDIRDNLDKFVSILEGMKCLCPADPILIDYNPILKEIGYEESERELYSEGLRIYAILDDDDREYEIEKFLNDNPNNQFGLHLKAEFARDRRKNKRLAEIRYKYIVDKFQEDELAYFNYAVLKENFGNLDEALYYYERGMKINPNSTEININYGSLLLMMNRISESVVYLKRALELSPDFDMSHYNYGMYLQKIGEDSEAEIYFKQALDINPNNALAYNGLGSSCYSLYGKDQEDISKKEEARQYFEKAIEIMPNNAMINTNYGVLLQDYEEYDKSRVHLKYAVELEPKSPIALHNYARFCYEVLHDFDLAEEYFRKAIEINPQSIESYKGLVFVFLDQKMNDEAKEYYQKARELDDSLPIIPEFEEE